MPYVPNYSNRRVYWASQETVSTWNAALENSAGSFDLATEGELVCGRPTRGPSLIWTTVDLWTMTFIGGDLIFSFQKVGNNCGIISPNAPVVLDTGAYWMGVNKKFFLFDGYVKTLNCDVAEYVFGDFNVAAQSTVWALANPAFNEITWFYPSSLATTPDRYVTYNYQENHWSYGNLPRVAGVTQFAGAPTPVPVLITSAGALFNHETGDTRTGMSPFLDSGPLTIDSGDRVATVQRIYPDDKTQGDVSATLFAALEIDSAETSQAVSLSSPTSVRLTGRHFRLRLTEAVATAWRVGVVKLGIILGGMR